jgi:imidazolonepropionase-like amidohydrolase
MKRRQLLHAMGMTLGVIAMPSVARAQGAKKDAAPKDATQRPRLAIVGGELHRAGEPPLKNSVVVIEGDKVVAIGGDEALARGATRVDAKGKIVTGGLIDPLTRVGITEVDLEDDARNDALATSRDVRAGFAAADGYDPASSLVAVTRKEGITSVGVTPTSGLVAGQSAWADLAGDTPDDALASRSLALHVLIDDYALDGTSKNSASSLYLLRELFDDATAYRANRAGFDRRQLRELGASRVDLEVAVRALEGKLPTVFHVDRASDILAVLSLAQSYKLRTVIASAAEGWKVAAKLAAAKVPAIVYPLDHGPRSFHARAAREENAALLVKAGVMVAMSSGESHNARKLRQIAGNAVRAGLAHASALDAVTDAPARIFGLDGYGSPKVGRTANLAVWSGDPFEISTRVDALVIRGAQVSLRSRQTALFEKYR